MKRLTVLGGTFALLALAACSPVQTKSASRPTQPPKSAQPDVQIETTTTTVEPATTSTDPPTTTATTAAPALTAPPPPAPTVAPTPVTHAVAAAPRAAAPTSNFQACVAMRESGNGSGSSNIYGFLQSTWNSLGRRGSPGSASRAEQDAAFWQLYARDGKAPWSPYDGCR